MVEQVEAIALCVAELCVLLKTACFVINEKTSSKPLLDPHVQLTNPNVIQSQLPLQGNDETPTLCNLLLRPVRGMLNACLNRWNNLMDRDGPIHTVECTIPRKELVVLYLTVEFNSHLLQGPYLTRSLLGASHDSDKNLWH